MYGETQHEHCRDSMYDEAQHGNCRHSTYDEAQPPASEQVDTLLEAEFQRRHLAQHDRPSLEECTEDEFEADLCDFLRQNQEPSLAKAVADHRITWYHCSDAATCAVLIAASCSDLVPRRATVNLTFANTVHLQAAVSGK